MTQANAVPLKVERPGGVRVRFAPSPTGFLHVGGARSLLFNWLYAQKTGGCLILRIEDTDQERSTRESEEKMCEDIRRLQLSYHEGPEDPKKGAVGPYRQSERLALYAQYAQQLVEEGKAYPCFCSEATLTEKRQMALKLGHLPHYDGTCAHLTPEQVREKYQAGEKAGIRCRAIQKTYVLEDRVRGRVEFKAGMVGDFFITRTPTEAEAERGISLIGFPVYNFCCAIDDHLMGITHVIRAEEHLSNTVRQLMIYEALGWTKLPEFAHISLILGPDRQKLSKRNGDTSVHDYLDQGYLPEALLNFLALLGWWPSSELTPQSGHPEILTREELIAHFDLDRLQKSPAVFDVQKLRWMNAYYLHRLSLAELATLARPFFIKAGLSLDLDSQWFEAVLGVVRGEAALLSELPQAAQFFFPVVDLGKWLEPAALEVLKNSASFPVVTAWKNALSQASESLMADEVASALKQVGAETATKGKSLYMPIRAVTTGRIHGPELTQVLPLLGKKTVLERIDGFAALGGLSSSRISL